MIPGQPGGPQNLPELARALTPVSRPNPLLIAWRWRYELVLAAGLPTASVFLARAVGWATAASIAGSLTASVAIVREASPGTELYYLDVEVWRATRRMRLRVVAVLVVILLAVLALMAGGYIGSSSS